MAHTPVESFGLRILVNVVLVLTGSRMEERDAECSALLRSASAWLPFYFLVRGTGFCRGSCTIRERLKLVKTFGIGVAQLGRQVTVGKTDLDTCDLITWPGTVLLPTHVFPPLVGGFFSFWS